MTIRVKGSILVNAPVEKLWMLATNPMLSPRWNANIVEIRDFSGLPIGVGSTWVQVLKILGKNTEMRAVVTECQAPESGTVQFYGPGDPRVTTDITEEGGGSRLTQTMDIVEVGGLMGFALRVARSTIEHDLNEALRRQKVAAEETLDEKEA